MPETTEDDQYVCSPEALLNCLQYLYGEAMSAGMVVPAHFIGVAAEATSDLVARYKASPGQERASTSTH